MKLVVTFKQLNHKFNKSYADEYHFGKESESNRKYAWETSFPISDCNEDVTIIENGSYNFEGNLKNTGEAFQFAIPNMMILNFQVNNELFQMAASRDLVLKMHSPHNAKYDVIRFYFYFKSNVEFVNPYDGIYISINDFPKELLVS